MEVNEDSTFISGAGLLKYFLILNDPSFVPLLSGTDTRSFYFSTIMNDDTCSEFSTFGGIIRAGSHSMIAPLLRSSFSVPIDFFYPTTPA